MVMRGESSGDAQQNRAPLQVIRSGSDPVAQKRALRQLIRAIDEGLQVTFGGSTTTD